jgi:large subunit ribosomal protein L15
MQIHDLKPRTKRATSNRIGRGGKRGKTSGKGHKGQKARAGGTPRPESRDLIKKIPKLRGRGVNTNKSINRDYDVVNLKQIEVNFKTGDNINPAELLKKGLIRKRAGKLPVVKILGLGDLSVKINVTGCLVSESAKAKIEAKGGKIAEKIS